METLRTYIIAMRQILVAQDIAMTIGEFEPMANVIIAEDIADAMSRAVGSIVLAFVDGPSWLAHPLPEETMQGAVMVGDAPTLMQTAFWGCLDLPFTTDHVVALLDRRAAMQDRNLCS